jgi:hypothetical protein
MPLWADAAIGIAMRHAATAIEANANFVWVEPAMIFLISC